MAVPTAPQPLTLAHLQQLLCSCQGQAHALGDFGGPLPQGLASSIPLTERNVQLQIEARLGAELGKRGQDEKGGCLLVPLHCVS
jgi:hypothetical protein